MLLLIAHLFMFCMVSCGPCTEMSSFAWLTGSWKMEQSNGKFRLESWQTDGNSFTGTGMKVSGGDTVLLEELKIICKNEQIHYTALVPDQNNAKPIAFNLVAKEDHRYTFENRLHDFPQRIIYDWKSKRTSSRNTSSPGDSLFVRVESISGDGFDFVFIRQ